MNLKTVIQAAWIDIGFEPSQTDEFGWIEYEVLPDDFDICLLEAKHSTKNWPLIDKTFVRPRILKGIEENNGWKVISSEEDLPEVDQCYWIKKKTGEEMISSFQKPISNKRWLNDYTHYQEIIKPKSPIH